MVELSELFGTGRAMLLVGAVLLYVASRAGAHALAGLDESPGRRAVGSWLPIAAAVFVAIVMRRGDWALSIIFATSVGCLSLLLGSICIVSPNSEASAGYRRFWPFVLPAALLALLVGFAGNLSWKSAVMLLIEGGALLFVWMEISKSEAAANERIGPGRPEKENSREFRAVDVGLCVLIGVIGAIAADIGAQRFSRDFPAIPDITIVVAILSPILVLPMLTGGAALAKKNRPSEAVTTAIAVVLLNICLLLPVAGLLWYLAQGVSGNSFHTIHLEMSAIRNAMPLPFGWVTWRVDSVVLVVLSFALLPAAMGRWKLGISEGMALIAVYGVYVLMEAAASLRS
jgi:Ca2+/Na+ antiporter